MFMTWFMFSCNYNCLGMSQWANIRNVNSLVVKHCVESKKRQLCIRIFETRISLSIHKIGTQSRQMGAVNSTEPLRIVMLGLDAVGECWSMKSFDNKPLFWIKLWSFKIDPIGVWYWIGIIDVYHTDIGIKALQQVNSSIGVFCSI